MITTLTSLKNDLVKRAASLKMKKYRQKEGLFLLEGKRAVEEALASGWTIRALFFTRLPEGWEQQAENSSLPWYEVPLPVLQKITATEDPQSVAALVELRREELAAFAPERGMVLVLDRIRDGEPGNLIRTADAWEPPGWCCWKIRRISTIQGGPVHHGSLFHLPVFTGVKTGELEEWCRQHGYALWATALEGAEDMTSLTWPEKTALVLGSEAEGVSPEILAAADQKVKIPMPAMRKA